MTGEPPAGPRPGFARRRCPHCGAAIVRWADRCPACGGKSPAQRPWYLYLLGGLLVLLLFLWLGDLGPLVQGIAELITQGDRQGQ